MDDNNINLQWAEHKEWFEKYHIKRDKFLNSLAESFFLDSGRIKDCMRLFFEYSLAIRAQVKLLRDEVKLDKDDDEALKLYNNKDYNNLLNKLKKLYVIYEDILLRLRITPKPEIEEKDEELNNLEDKTRAALDAWKLIYSKDK